MRRIDEFVSHEINGIRYRRGRLLPFGATVIGDNAVNFSVYSKDAYSCLLVLYKIGADEPFVEIPFEDEFRTGSVFAMMVFDLDWEKVEYGYRFDGPTDRSKGYRFDKSKVLLDPYAKLVSGRDVFNKKTYPGSNFQCRGRIIREDFNWEGDKPLCIPFKDLIIYEAHLRGFTMDPSSGVKYGGTYAGFIEKIPHLKKLGINAIEFMPIFEFDEFVPELPAPACNYWGYMTYNYFSPKTGFSATGSMGLAADEMKNLVKQLHKAGIEVILDIVFNHTAEFGDEGPTLSFKGIDNRTWYIMGEDGNYLDYSGCKNTLNCNNPVVRSFILDSLRYWVSDYHIDAFRVDEAPIFTRGQDGRPIVSPPLVEALENDPVLSSTAFISEGFDFGGLYTIGKLPVNWADWNPRTRDTYRRLAKAFPQNPQEVIDSFSGSPDLFGSPDCAINYADCHDGLTLYDLVAYNGSHADDVGMVNPFSVDHVSWNCGIEGETNDPEVNALRHRQIKNLISYVLMSRGVPMFFMGDEFANSQKGNGNAYMQDNPIGWLNWERLKDYDDVFEYFRTLIAFRKEHPVFRTTSYSMGHNSSGYPEMSWHGERAWQLDMSSPLLTFAVMYSEPKADFGTKEDCFIYCAVNSHWEEHTMQLPIIPDGMKWSLVAYSGDEQGARKGEIINGYATLMPRSFMVLIGK